MAAVSDDLAGVGAGSLAHGIDLRLASVVEIRTVEWWPE